MFDWAHDGTQQAYYDLQNWVVMTARIKSNLESKMIVLYTMLPSILSDKQHFHEIQYPTRFAFVLNNGSHHLPIPSWSKANECFTACSRCPPFSSTFTTDRSLQGSSQDSKFIKGAWQNYQFIPSHATSSIDFLKNPLLLLYVAFSIHPP
jgi:hypothetical protein